jgi:hypothetical protein
MKNFKPIVLSIISMYIFCGILAYFKHEERMQDKSFYSKESNRIYYEYNVINGDTIPIDTVYYPLNKRLPNQ